MDTATGRFYSDSGGLFMVTGTFHVKTEVLVVPGECKDTPTPHEQTNMFSGHKKKQKKKSFKNNKIQLKLQICANGRCRTTR